MANLAVSFMPTEAPRPLAPLHDLASVATDFPALEGDRWMAGLAYSPEIGFDGGTFSFECVSGTSEFSTPVSALQPVGNEAVGIESAFQCATFGWQAIDYAARATRQLEAISSSLIEYDFWTGTQVPTNQTLARSTPNTPYANGKGILGSGAVSAVRALGWLLDALTYGPSGRGTIHATQAIVDAWVLNGSVIRVGDHLETATGGHFVAAGQGYPGTGPVGAAAPTAEQAWAFATSGQVRLKVSPIELLPPTLSEALDRADNTIRFRGKQMYLADWDGAVSAAVLVTKSS